MDIRKIIQEEINDFDWTDEADVSWSTYYNEIYNDVLNLPRSVDNVGIHDLMPIFYKLDVLTREIKKGSELKDTELVDNIHWNMEYIIKMVSGSTTKHEAQYVKAKDDILFDIKKLIIELKLISE